MPGCCIPVKRDEPPYPSKVLGWKDYEDQGVKFRGNFILRKNEATDNGKLQIKVLDIIPPDPCAEGGTFPRQARVKLQMVRLSDKKMLCTDTFPENGGGRFSPECGGSLDECGISALHVLDINLEEGWAYFDIC
jgi:hypothetical protein